MKFLIDHFGTCNLFGTENYRYYSRITGEIANPVDYNEGNMSLIFSHIYNRSMPQD